MSGVLKIPRQKASARCGGSETHIPGACSSSNWRSSICFRLAGDGTQVPSPARPLLPWRPPARTVPPAPSRAPLCWAAAVLVDSPLPGHLGDEHGSSPGLPVGTTGQQMCHLPAGATAARWETFLGRRQGAAVSRSCWGP